MIGVLQRLYHNMEICLDQSNPLPAKEKFVPSAGKPPIIKDEEGAPSRVAFGEMLRKRRSADEPSRNGQHEEEENVDSTSQEG